MRLLIAIVKHRVAWDKRASLDKIRENIDGVVHVKLAQFLSNFELIIGKDVAAEFRKVTHDAPSHPLSYSKEILEEDFGDKYNLDNSTLVGSGSIAQIHKLAGRDIVVKVVHPHTEKEIISAIDAYNIFQGMWFLPAKLKVVCDVFFDGLKVQLDMRKEAQSAYAFPNTELYVCPKPLDASRRCLVMTYEPSSHLNTIVMSDQLRCCAYHAIAKFSNVCLEKGWVHADMHEGNFGIRHTGDKLEKVVIYDFGFVYDLSRDIPLTTRRELSISSERYNFERYKNAMIKILDIDEYDTEDLDVTPTLKQFTRNMEMFVLYYFTLCDLNETGLKLISSLEKYYPYAKELMNLERKGVKKLFL